MWSPFTRTLSRSAVLGALTHCAQCEPGTRDDAVGASASDRAPAAARRETGPSHWAYLYPSGSPLSPSVSPCALSQHSCVG